MERPMEGASARLLARVGGALYLIIIVVGLFGELFVRNRLLVSGDAAATAANIRAHEALWRFHIVAELFLLICAVALLLILFVLLRPAGRDLALLAVFFNLVSIAVEASTTLSLVDALFPLANTGSLKAFAPAQLYVMTSLSLRSHAYGFGVSLVFFACFCLVIGVLIFRSGYLPKTIGILMQIAGLCYLANSFALIIAPAVANRMFAVILLPAFIGELSFCVWLLVAGVNVEGWNRKMADSASR